MSNIDDQIKMMKILLANGADVNPADNDGNTALIHGAKADHGNSEMAQLLLDHGANVNAANKEGNTALMCAIDKSHSEIVDVLLKGGANPDIENKAGKTAWDLAENKPKILKILENYRNSGA